MLLVTGNCVYYDPWGLHYDPWGYTMRLGVHCDPWGYTWPLMGHYDPSEYIMTPKGYIMTPRGTLWSLGVHYGRWGTWLAHPGGREWGEWQRSWRQLPSSSSYVSATDKFKLVRRWLRSGLHCSCANLLNSSTQWLSLDNQQQHLTEHLRNCFPEQCTGIYNISVKFKYLKYVIFCYCTWRP